MAPPPDAAAVDQANLRKFKAALQSSNTTVPASLMINDDFESTLLRFLKARQGSLEKAYAMLIKCIRWREQNKTARCAARPRNS